MSELYGIDREKSFSNILPGIIDITSTTPIEGDYFSVEIDDNILIPNQWYFLDFENALYSTDGGDIQNKTNSPIYLIVLMYRDTNELYSNNIYLLNSSESQYFSRANRSQLLFTTIKKEN